MPFEIERKFLVRGDFRKEASHSEEIIQGYLSSVPERSVRVRVKGDKAYLSIKGKSNDEGLTRYEWEKEITLSEAKELLRLCEPGVIDKIRHYIPSGKHTFEVDEFRGENQGLIMAEIELSDESEFFDKPEWLGEEVTGDTRYYNASLTKNPYINWKQYD